MASSLPDTAPVSLYFDLPHNQAMSLRSIGQAAVAWDELIRELASVADPSVDVSVDFLSGTVGSRSINSVITATKKAATDHPWTAGSLGALAGVFLLAPANLVATDMTRHLAKEWLGYESNTLTDDDVERVAQRTVELQRDRDAMGWRDQIYDAGSSDPRVIGIGAAPKIERPKSNLIIPRSSFEDYRSIETTIDEPTEARTVYETDQVVTIVRSYSKGEERRWRFEDGRGEFSATMRDPEFLEALRAQKTGIPIGEGVTMTVDFRIRQELIDGLWEDKEIDVMRVVKPNIRLQSSLNFTPDQPDEADGK